MRPYTPTTEAVRRAYAEEFDRWLETIRGGDN